MRDYANGPANMDRRSFDLNYENNILLCESALMAEMCVRQGCLSGPIARGEVRMVADWPITRRLWPQSLPDESIQ